MLKRSLLLTVWTIACLSAFAQPFDYSGYKIVRTYAKNEIDVEKLESMVTTICNCIIGPGYLEVCVSPDELKKLTESGFIAEVVIGDVRAAIERQTTRIAGENPFGSYKTYDEIVEYLYMLQRTYPNLAQVFSIGNSYQGRRVYGIKITEGVRLQRSYRSRPASVVQGCQHAREWIATMAPIYTATRLLNDYGVDARTTKIVRECETYIIPVVNPDGNVYTWTNQRMWRKNRRPVGSNVGVDLNRNWGYQWGGQGSSGSTGSETYRGPSAFSEIETTNLRRFLQSLPNLTTHMDIHSYSQLILWPWGYTSNLPANNATYQQLVGRMKTEMEALYGYTYTIGPIYTTIYPASGNSVDWIHGDRRAIGISYELRDTGDFGFLLPPEQIVPASEESHAGLMEMFEWTRRRGK